MFVYENVSGGVEEFRENVTIAGDVTVLNLTNQILRPNRLYRVSVVAYNRAGRGEEGRSILFPTLEDGEFMSGLSCANTCNSRS